MRLLFITTDIQSSGGVSKVLWMRTKALIDIYGYDITIINTHGSVNNLFYDFHPEIKFIQLVQYQKVKRLFNYFVQLRSVIVKENPDLVINCDNGLKGALFPLFVKLNCPIFYEDHTSISAYGNGFTARVKLRLTRCIHSWLDSAYRKIVQVHDANLKSNSIVIPNPIIYPDTQEISSQESPIVVAIGRFVPEKGYDRLVRIWSRIVSSHNDWILKIYGEGDRSELNQQIKSLGLEQHVELHPATNKIDDVLRKASILVNTSRYESFGLAILEAMSYGLAIVSFSTQGSKMLISHEEDGLLIENGQEERFAAQLSKLMDNKSYRQKLAANARIKSEKYTLESVVSKWHSLLHEAFDES